MSTILEFIDLKVAFGPSQPLALPVVHGINFSVDAGEIIVFQLRCRDPVAGKDQFGRGYSAAAKRKRVELKTDLQLLPDRPGRLLRVRTKQRQTVFLGRAHLGAIHGLMRPFATVAGAFGPLIIAGIYDTQGAYYWAWVFVIGGWVLGSVAIAQARRPVPLLRSEIAKTKAG